MHMFTDHTHTRQPQPGQDEEYKTLRQECALHTSCIHVSIYIYIYISILFCC